VTPATTLIKKALVKSIPRQAVLKPSNAVYKLQNQKFALGDRVVMVLDSGGVPLGAKGIVVAINAPSGPTSGASNSGGATAAASGGKRNMDVVWDVPFMSGTSLGDR
jgi:hypothetical protein